MIINQDGHFLGETGVQGNRFRCVCQLKCNEKVETSMHEREEIYYSSRKIRDTERRLTGNPKGHNQRVGGRRRGPVNEVFTKVYVTVFQGMQIGQSKENICEGAIHVILLLTISFYLCQQQ